MIETGIIVMTSPEIKNVYQLLKNSACLGSLERKTQKDQKAALISGRLRRLNEALGLVRSPKWFANL
jgi:hypothetical protein